MGGPLSIEETIQLGDALFRLRGFHARQTEHTGHLITKFEAQLPFIPDLYIVSGTARDQVREFIAKIIENEEKGINELERLYKLDPGKGAASGG